MKIKNILAGLSLLMMFFSYSQNVSDYQYIIVAEKFSGFKPNQYKLNDFVIKSTLDDHFVYSNNNVIFKPCN